MFYKKLMAIAAVISLVCFVSATPVLAKSSTAEASKTKKETVAKKSTTKSKKTSSKAKEKSKTSSSKKFTGKVNVNKAKAEELTQLVGIGPVTAKKIVEYRKKHGAFKSVDDLLQVKGIGPKTLEKIKKNITLK